MTTTTPDTDHIIKKNVIWASAAGAVPIPLIDIAAVTSVQLDMLKSLCYAHDVAYSSVKGKALISSISGSLIARYWASLIKTVPGIGSWLGIFSMSIMSGASTYALGKVFEKYLKEEGSLDKIDKEEAQKMFRREFRKGRSYAKWIKQEEQDVFAKLEKLGALKEKGIITEEEFDAKKKTLLERIN